MPLVSSQSPEMAIFGNSVFKLSWGEDLLSTFLHLSVIMMDSIIAITFSMSQVFYLFFSFILMNSLIHSALHNPMILRTLIYR